MKRQISSIWVQAVNSCALHALKGSHKPSCSTWSKIVVFGSAVLLADARIHHSFNSCESWRSSSGRNEPKSRRRQRRQNNPDILISSFSAETGSTRGKIRTGWWKKVPENWVSSPKTWTPDGSPSHRLQQDVFLWQYLIKYYFILNQM